MGLHAMSQRFFKSTAQVYELVRQTLDTQWGFPNAGTDTCFLPASDIAAPKDAEGKVLLAVDATWCEWEDVSPTLSQLISVGKVVETTAQEYQNAVERIEAP